MRRAATLALLLAAATAGVANAQTLGAHATTRAIDPAKSSASFRVTHIFVGHVDGTIPIVAGTVTLADNSAVPLAARATLDPGRVQSGDDDRNAALRSPDFFDVQHFPRWTFASTHVEPHGPTSFGMDGTLTIHGVAQSVHLDGTVVREGGTIDYRATGEIDRHAFGMKITRLDPVIGNPVAITLDIVLESADATSR